MSKLYFGANEIVNVEDLEDGSKRVEVRFPEPVVVSVTEEGEEITDIGEKFTIPAWELQAVATPEPTDRSEVRNLRANYVVEKILEVLQDLDIREHEFAFYNQKLLQSMQASEHVATLGAFNVSDINDIRISNWRRASGEIE